MKGLLLAILATLAGLAMLGGGVYGVIDSTGDDDDDPVTTTPTLPTFPTAPTAPGAPDPCLQATARDLRLGLLDDLDLEPVGRERGTAEVRATCTGPVVSLNIRLVGVSTGNESNSYFIWLYKNRRKAEQIGSMIGPEDSAFGAATITSDIDTNDYDEIVISRVEFGVGEKRPRRIVFRGSL